MKTRPQIVPYAAHYHQALLSIWQRGVKRTHTFLSEEDFIFYHNIVDSYALTNMDVWVAVDDNSCPLGFIGLADAMIEMLFVDPVAHRQGVGTALLDFATKEKGASLVDVNEQNPGACAFYRKYGFIETARSPQDDRGKPYPIIHAELKIT